MTSIATAVLVGVTGAYVALTKGLSNASHDQATIAQRGLVLAYQPYVFIKPDWARLEQRGVPIAIYNNTQADAFRCVACLGYRESSGVIWLATRDFYVGRSSKGTDFAFFQEGECPRSEITGDDQAFSVVFCQNVDGEEFRCRSAMIRAEPASTAKDVPQWVNWYSDQLKEAARQEHELMAKSLKALAPHGAGTETS